MRDHQNQIKEMMEFVEVKYPTCALQVVTFDLENDVYNWFDTKKDFDYKKKHPNVIKAFMA